jgi:hypothetical protein
MTGHLLVKGLEWLAQLLKSLMRVFHPLKNCQKLPNNQRKRMNKKLKNKMKRGRRS